MKILELTLCIILLNMGADSKSAFYYNERVKDIESITNITMPCKIANTGLLLDEFNKCNELNIDYLIGLRYGE